MEYPHEPFEASNGMPCALNWIRCWGKFEWVFWSKRPNDELDYQRKRIPLMAAAAADHVVPSIQIEEEIIRSYYSMIPTCIGMSLVQFWAPVKVNGSTFLSIADQPFFFCTNLDMRLCSYRRLCLRTLISIDDGPVGRVFRSGIKEYNPDLLSYSAGEFPLLEDAIQLGIRRCWAWPWLTSNGRDCVGVFEISTINPGPCPPPLYTKSFVPLDMVLALNQIEAGLHVVRGILSSAFAQVWTSFYSYYIDALKTYGRTSYDSISSSMYDEFAYASDICGSQRGKAVVGRALSSQEACFCKDVTLLSLTEYPLVPSARKARLTRCFAICLRSKCVNNFVCVVEYFLPPKKIVDRNIKTSLNTLLFTLKEKFPDFIVASGKELGQRMLVEVVKGPSCDEVDPFEIGQPLPSVQSLQDGGKMTEIDSLLQQSNLQNVGRPVEVDLLPQHPIEAAVTNRGRIDVDVAHDVHIEIEKDTSEMMQLDSHSQQPNVDIDSSSNNDKVEHSDITRCGRQLVEDEAINGESNIVNGPVTNIQQIDSQKNDTIQRIAKDYGITREILEQHFGKTVENAAKALKVSRSTLKRIRKEYGISRWPHYKTRKVHPHVSQGVSLQDSEPYVGDQELPNLSPEKGTADLTHKRSPATGKSCDSVMTVKVTYRDDIIKFKLTPSSTRVELEGKVEKGFNILLAKFSIKYQDEDNEWILITSDSDLRDGMDELRLLKRTTMRLLVTLK